MKQNKDYAGIDAERQFAQRSHRPMDDALEKKEDLQIDHHGNYKIDPEATRINDHVEDHEPLASDHEPRPIREQGIELPEEEHRIIHGDEGVIPVNEREVIKPGPDESYPTTNEEIISEEESLHRSREPRKDEIDHGSLGNQNVLDNAQGTVVVEEPVVKEEDPTL